MENNQGYLHYNSLNTTIQDLFNMIRNSNIAESENISKNQVEQWVHQYRSILLKQDLDKNRYINQNYVQEINGLEMVAVNTGYLVNDQFGGIDVLVSSTRIPKTIDLHFKTGIVMITTVDGREIQLMPESRAIRQFDRKWTSDDMVAFMREDMLYLLGADMDNIEMVNVKVLLENPTEIGEVLTITGYHDYNRNEPYHMPATMIPIMKEMIMAKELGIMINQTPDIVNDGTESALLEKQEYSQAVSKRNRLKQLGE